MEIELKARIADARKMREALLAKGMNISYEEKQIDTYFKEKGKELMPQRVGSFILRIRESRKGAFLTYKELTKDVSAWVEHDLTISDAKAMGEIFKKLNYVPALEIKKHRVAGKLDSMKVCIDEIEGLGPYIECEVISEDVETAKQSIMSFFGKVGIEKEAIEKKGYAQILFERKGVIYEIGG